MSALARKTALAYSDPEKAIAFVFLTVMTFVEPGAWIVPFSAVVDGLMGAAVFLVRRRLRELGTAPV